MEITNLYTILDVKANLYSPPISFKDTQVFSQYLEVLVNTHGTGHYHLYPEDFVGYCIGTFNEQTGQIQLLAEREFAVNLAGLKRPCKYCDQPEEKANEQSKQIFERSFSQNAAQ